ncbi:integrase catalytic domain-containing protein [Pseudarthrobacter sp. So.54]
MIRVWLLAGMPSGKYLAATMDLWLPRLEALGELRKARFSPEVREQLMTVSGATIDRLLRPTRAGMAPKGLSATKAGSELRSSIAVRRAGQEHEQVPGFIEPDLVAHCGPALVGEFARTLTAADVFTGWTENVAIRNSAYKWILAAMETVAERLPFLLTGLDTDNGGEFINQALVGWATARDIYFTRARPYKSNDNAHVEQKSGDIVRRHAFHYRYDTALELQQLNELYDLVRIRFNMFTATKKAIGWRENRNGHKTRVYDKPRSPYQRVTDAGVLTPPKPLNSRPCSTPRIPPISPAESRTSSSSSSASPPTRPKQYVSRPREQKYVRHAQPFREHLDVRHYAADLCHVP